MYNTPPFSFPREYAMATEYFDIDSLAAYLHLIPAQVLRLADRGKLPGRRVSGQWRFSRAEIHHWLEHRIGLSDEEELVHMEGVLQRSALLSGGPSSGDQPSGERPITLSELLSIDTVAVPLEAKTRSSVIREMANLAARSGALWDPEKMADALRIREEMQPTALDIGVALLHPRRPMPRILEHSFLAMGVTATGIPFGGSHGTLTDVFFLIGADSDQTHLRILTRLSRLVANAETLADLRAAGDAASVYHRIVEWDDSIQ